MKSMLSFALVAAAGLVVGVVPAFGQATGGVAAVAEQGDPNLPLRRITLYRSGVGAFERRGLIEGDANVQLRFDTKQINDILKSMIVLDLSKGQGRIEGVSYGSKEPLSKRLSSFAVDISDDPSTQVLLGRLRGAEVSLKLAEGRELVGTVLGVETRQEPANKDAVTNVAFVNVLTADGVVSVRLPQVVSFDLRDAALKSELNKALSALAEYRADRTKTVDVRLAGQGAREIVVGYVQESPVWKTSYRLILPDTKKDAKAEKGAEKGAETKEGVTLQGWAIVENTTDEDWNQVTLSLVSGRPVSFTMDLYEPLYVTRPDVPVPTVPGVMPRMFEGGQSPFQDQGGFPEDPGEASSKRFAGNLADAAPLAPSGGGGGGSRGGAMYKLSERDDALSSEDLASYAARTQAAAMEVGEVFQYQLESPVSVERQRSAMLPILSAGIEGRRVSIYNPADGSSHPMRGVEIVNTSKLQLMPGPISVFDSGAYAGDAQVGHVPAGDKRLLAYSVDLEVDVTSKSEDNTQVRRIKVSKGVVQMQSLVRSTTTYEFVNKDRQRERTLIVEHPRNSGWTLKQPEKPSEQTAQTYRFEVQIDAGKTSPLSIVQEIETRTEYQTGQFSLQSMIAYSKNGAASDAVVEAFREIARRQGELAGHQRTIDDLNNERARIGEEQNRIRQNMNTIERESDLYRRYMTKFTEQESRLEAITEESLKAKQALDATQASLDAFVAALSVE